MRARQWMIACVLSLAGIGVAMAADMDTRDVSTTTHSSSASPTRDGNSASGDALGFGRGNTSSRPHASSDSSDSNRSGGTAGGSEHGGRISAPTSAQPETLGWQSLLPGSIQ